MKINNRNAAAAAHPDRISIAAKTSATTPGCAPMSALSVSDVGFDGHDAEGRTQ